MTPCYNARQHIYKEYHLSQWYYDCRTITGQHMLRDLVGDGYLNAKSRHDKTPLDQSARRLSSPAKQALSVNREVAYSIEENA